MLSPDLPLRRLLLPRHPFPSHMTGIGCEHLWRVDQSSHALGRIVKVLSRGFVPVEVDSEWMTRSQ